MSYEYDFSNSTKCPCGKGTLIVKQYSNDWNQIRYETVIKCDLCKKKYDIEEGTHVSSKGERDDIFYLVNRETGEKTEIQWNKRG